MYVCMYVCMYVQQILACSLSLALKTEALQHVAIATIEHHFVNVQFAEENPEVKLYAKIIRS